ncbi:phosphohydrolase [Candidatus Microgenomates bacterium]|nr:MAG: phosphohydrolase [Candidatus Microgenomates bacterium]
MLTRDQAIDLLHAHMQNQNLRRHCYAVGFVMRSLAEYFQEDPDEWEVLGIIHDLDWEETKNTPTEHTKKTLAYLAEKNITEGTLVHALQSHNRKLTHLAELEGDMEWSLECCDELTGFIVAVALVRPDAPSSAALDGQVRTKLQMVTVDSILKKWKNKEFAKAVDRKQIEQCEKELGIGLEQFMAIALLAMQTHHEDLGL